MLVIYTGRTFASRSTLIDTPSKTMLIVSEVTKPFKEPELLKGLE